MIQTIFQAFVTTASVVTMATTPVSIPATPIQVSEEHFHVVKPGETLSIIAGNYYHNSDAWSSILKDNPQIVDPNRVEKGMMLKIRYIPQLVADSEIASSEVIEPRTVDSIALEATQVGVTAIAAAQTPTAAPVIYTGGPLTEEQLTFLGNCEAGMNPTRNSGNGYYGAFQFSYGTWQRMNTGYERADLAPLEVQKAAVQKLLSTSSLFGQFPGCARKMRAEGLI
jgi:hypothetical protein